MHLPKHGIFTPSRKDHFPRDSLPEPQDRRDDGKAQMLRSIQSQTPN